MEIINKYNNLKREYNNLIKEYNDFKKNRDSFDTYEYFLNEFKRVIKNFENIMNIKEIFNIMFYSFDFDMYIFLTYNKYKEYYDLNKLNNNELYNLIDLFLEHYINFYKVGFNNYFYNFFLIDTNKFNNIFEKYNNHYINNLTDEDKYDELFNFFETIKIYIIELFIDYDSEKMWCSDAINDLCRSTSRIYEKYFDEDFDEEKFINYYFDFILEEMKDDKKFNYNYISKIPKDNYFYKTLLCKKNNSKKKIIQKKNN